MGPLFPLDVANQTRARGEQVNKVQSREEEKNRRRQKMRLTFSFCLTRF